MPDPAFCKWKLTFAYPQDHGWTHDRIKEVLSTFPALRYWCMVDGISFLGNIPYTHLFLDFGICKCRFIPLKNAFFNTHIEQVTETSLQYRNYVAGEGEWADGKNLEVSVPGTFEEWGKISRDYWGRFRYRLCLARWCFRV